MSIDKLKTLIPEMEQIVKESIKEDIEKGFTFRTNKDAQIEEFCKTGKQCRIEILPIKKREGTKTGNFHTHPHTTITDKMTFGIGGIFSCSDILFQIDNNIDHACIGTKDEIVCSTLKSKVPENIKWLLINCGGYHQIMIEDRKEIKGYVGSTMEKNDIKLLDKLERASDIKLRPYIDFDVIKKLK